MAMAAVEPTVITSACAPTQPTGNRLKLPPNPLKLPPNRLKLRPNPLKLQPNRLKLPHNPLKLPHNPLKLPLNPLKLPLNPLNLPLNPLNLPLNPLNLRPNPLELRLNILLMPFATTSSPPPVGPTLPVLSNSNTGSVQRVWPAPTRMVIARGLAASAQVLQVFATMLM